MSSFYQKIIYVVPLCFSIEAFSGHKGPGDAPGFYADLPIIISATRLNQSVLKSPSAVTVLDRDMIRASGFTEIADLFRLVPGFQVVHADGRTFAVTYHGGGWELPNRLQVLVNGRSTYTPSFSTVDWDVLGVHILDIERIEIVRGPSASAFGSNSFSAAINIITRPVELDEQFTLATRIGSQGDKEAVVRGSRQSDDFNYRISAWHRQNKGFDDYPDHRRFNNVAFQGEKILSHRQDLKAYLSVSEGDTGVENNAFYPERNRDVDAASGHINWLSRVDDKHDIRINLYHNYQKNDDLTQTPLLSTLFGMTADEFAAAFGTPDQTVTSGTLSYTTEKTDIEWQLNGIRPNGLQYVAGIGGRYEVLKSPIFIEPYDVYAPTIRLFGNVQIPLAARWTLNAGSIIERDDFDQSYVSSRASLNWKLSGNQSLRMGFSQAWRIPSLLEKNFAMRTTLDNGFVIDDRIIADTALKAEHIRSVELGWVGKHIQYPINWELKMYHERINNIMRFVLDTSVDNPIGLGRTQLTNVGYYITNGIEGELTYRPLKDSFIRFHFNWGKNREYAKRRAVEPFLYTENTNRAPDSSVGLLLSHQVNSWTFNSGVYYVGGMRWNGLGDEVESYTRVDLSVNRDLKISPRQTLSIKLAAQNLGNRYHEFSFEQTFEPRYYISVTYSE